MMDNIPEQYRLAGEAFAEAYSQSSFMENTRSGTLARLTKQHQEQSNQKISHAAAENAAKASDEWFEFNWQLAKAKEKTEVLRSQKKYIELVAWEQNDKNATHRIERKLG